jgi:AhpD family alkylhydroperoxidase
MPNDTFSAREKELIALGASVASGCQPCTEYHVRAARSAGVCDRGIFLAVETAVALRNSSTRAMDKWAERCQGSRTELDPEFRAQTRLIRELILIASAVCVNSVADLTLHLTAARELGATSEQISLAIAVARAIKKIAAEKLEAIIGDEAGSGCCEPEGGRGAMMTGGPPACGCR